MTIRSLGLAWRHRTLVTVRGFFCLGTWSLGSVDELILLRSSVSSSLIEHISISTILIFVYGVDRVGSENYGSYHMVQRSHVSTFLAPDNNQMSQLKDNVCCRI